MFLNPDTRGSDRDREAASTAAISQYCASFGQDNVSAAAIDKAELGLGLRPHPAIPSSEATATFGRVFFVAFFLFVLTMLTGCASWEHPDGGGYTVRYAGDQYPPPPQPRPKAKPRPPVQKVVMREEPAEVRGERESHPVLNIGKDDEIPREYAKYVSDRSLKGLRSRMNMCTNSRPGYCNAPNVPHCHGPFCHSHVGGDRRHTH